ARLPSLLGQPRLRRSGAGIRAGTQRRSGRGAAGDRVHPATAGAIRRRHHQPRTSRPPRSAFAPPDRGARRDVREREALSGGGALRSWLVPLMSYNPAEALLILDRVHADTFPNIAINPRELLLAWAHEALGDAVRAREEYEAAVPKLEALVKLHADDAPLRGNL